jgi:4a-hydroxytetrahydrobiopterin dehydratase
MNENTMYANLSELHCSPLKGVQHKLSEQHCDEYLAMLNGWQLTEHGQAIGKIVHFNNYYQTMAFVNALAFIAHQEDHHPDLSVHYNRCEIRYSTHDVGGLSLNDFICAAKTEQLLTR